MSLKDKILLCILGVLGGLVLVIGLSMLLSVPVTLLWNGLLPAIFGLPKLTYMQGWGISLLTGLLFKSTVSK